MSKIYILDNELVIPFVDRLADEPYFIVRKNDDISEPVFLAKKTKSLKGGYEKYCEHEHELKDVLGYLHRNFKKKAGKNSGVLKWLCPKCQKTAKIRAFDPHVIFSFFPETFGVRDYPQAHSTEDNRKLLRLKNMSREDFIDQIKMMILQRIGKTTETIEDDFNLIRKAAETDTRLRNVLDSFPKEFQICMATSYVFQRFNLSFTNIIAVWLFVLYKSLMYEGLEELRNDLKPRHPDEIQTLKHVEALLNFEEKLLYEVCEIKNKTYETARWNIFEYLFTEVGNCMGFSQTVYSLMRQLIPINRIHLFAWLGHVNLGLAFPNPSEELIDRYISNDLGIVLYEPTKEREKAKKQLSVLIYETTIKHRIKFITFEEFFRKKPDIFFIQTVEPTEINIDYLVNGINSDWHRPYFLVKIFQICEPYKWEYKFLVDIADLSMGLRVSEDTPYLIFEDKWIKEKWLGGFGSLLGNLPEFMEGGRLNRITILKPLLYCFCTSIVDAIKNKWRNSQLDKNLVIISSYVEKTFDIIKTICEESNSDMIAKGPVREAKLIRIYLLKAHNVNFYKLYLEDNEKFQQFKIYLIKISRMILSVSSDTRLSFEQKINVIATRLLNSEFILQIH